jgi:hypothetical protein
LSEEEWVVMSEILSLKFLPGEVDVVAETAVSSFDDPFVSQSKLMSQSEFTKFIIFIIAHIRSLRLKHKNLDDIRSNYFPTNYEKVSISHIQSPVRPGKFKKGLKPWQIEYDSSGLSFPEFLKIARSKFNVLDIDGSGYLSLDRVIELLNWTWAFYTPWAVNHDLGVLMDLCDNWLLQGHSKEDLTSDFHIHIRDYEKWLRKCHIFITGDSALNFNENEPGYAIKNAPDGIGESKQTDIDNLVSGLDSIPPELVNSASNEWSDLDELSSQDFIEDEGFVKEIISRFNLHDDYWHGLLSSSSSGIDILDSDTDGSYEAPALDVRIRSPKPKTEVRSVGRASNGVGLGTSGSTTAGFNKESASRVTEQFSFPEDGLLAIPHDSGHLSVSYKFRDHGHHTFSVPIIRDNDSSIGTESSGSSNWWNKLDIDDGSDFIAGDN